MHLKVLQLRYSGRDSIIQVRIDLIFIMVPLGEQKQNGGGKNKMEEYGRPSIFNQES